MMFIYRNTAVASIAAATLVACAYVLWGPFEKRKKRKRDTCPGLHNLGNTCFLNAILQALAPCQSIIQWLERCVKLQLSRNNNNYLSATILSTLKVLNNKGVEEKDMYQPVGVLNALRSKWIIPNDEQDAHELFLALTQTLEEETGYHPKVLSLFDVSALQSSDNKNVSDNSAMTRGQGLLPVLPVHRADQPFKGHLASQLRCQTCGYCYSVKYDMFDTLSLNIPDDHWGPMSLEQLLHKFISSETVTNVECPGCSLVLEDDEKKVLHSNFQKKLSLGKLPQCLSIHIPRTHWLNSDMPVKRFEQITFPEILQMDDYIYKKGSLGGDKKSWLFGGRAMNLNRPVNNGHILNNRMTSSIAVNLLRSLNHHSRSTMNELFVKPPNPPLYTNVPMDVNQNGPNPPKYEVASHTYKLVAVVEHIGNVMSGHFISYRRAPPSQHREKYSDRWLFTSDSVVKKVSLDKVLSAEAYMLFYERL